MASLQEAYTRYLTHYIQVIQQASKLYKGRQGQTLAGLALFDVERHQIQCAWDWLCAQAISDRTDGWLIECARHLAIVGYSRYSLWSELVPILDRGIAAAQRRSLPGIRAELLVRSAQVDIALGDHYRALSLCKEAEAVIQMGADAALEPAVWLNMGSAYTSLGNHTSALDCYNRALRAAQQSGDKNVEGAARCNQGIVFIYLQDYDQAVEAFHQALSSARETSNCLIEQNVYLNLAMLYADQFGRPDEAIEYLDKALALAQLLSDLQAESKILCTLARVHHSAGNTPRAIDYFERAAESARRAGSPVDESIAITALADVYKLIIGVPATLQYLEGRLAEAKTSGDRLLQARLLAYEGLLYDEAKRPAEFLECLGQALGLARQLGDRNLELAISTNVAVELLKNPADWRHSVDTIARLYEFEQEVGSSLAGRLLGVLDRVAGNLRSVDDAHAQQVAAGLTALIQQLAAQSSSDPV